MMVLALLSLSLLWGVSVIIFEETFVLRFFLNGLTGGDEWIFGNNVAVD